jgi:hypothetical protein
MCWDEGVMRWMAGSVRCFGNGKEGDGRLEAGILEICAEVVERWEMKNS